MLEGTSQPCNMRQYTEQTSNSNRLPHLTTCELFLLEEQPAPHFLGLGPIYWTATKVKVGTFVDKFYRTPVDMRFLFVHNDPRPLVVTVGDALTICLHESFRRLATRPHAELWVRTSANNPSATFRNVGPCNRSEAASHGVRYPRYD